MDTDDLEPIDILAYTTEELQSSFKGASTSEQGKLCLDFLRRWEADSALAKLKQMKIEFQKDLDWFNVSEPLTIEGLRGKIVILDFFTYCCINCMHILPELHALEELFPIERGLVVVGVHSPKFENEKDAANILAAAQRYGITHPIVNDPRMSLWRAIGIRCWPSLVVISPKGEPLLLLMGEGHSKLLECFVDQALRYFDHKGEIAKFSLPLRPSTDLLPASNLRFPAKIARSADGHFAVADAGNHRIILFNPEGVVEQKVGDGVAGFIDGDFTKARFNSPQGLDFLDSEVLIVADTENHAVRLVNLKTGKVETLAGTGQQGSDRVGGKVGPLQAISSPWDIAAFRTRDMDMSFHLNEGDVQEKPIVLIAMAGTHQVWGYFPEGIVWWKYRSFEPRSCVSIIGSGLEENRNNSYPQNAGFAQPSGLAMSENFIFIADSESSSIRKVSMVDGKVMPVVGGDRNPLNLFAFGDVDGKQFSARLQHPLAIAYNHVNDKVYVADTYNHKIKMIDYSANSIESLSIEDSAGAKYKFNEPAGLCFNASGEFLLVSDTNNHTIQRIDIKTLTTKPFVLDFSKIEVSSETDGTKKVNDNLQLVKKLPLHNCGHLKLQVSIKLADGLKFTTDAPQRWTLQTAHSTLRTTNNRGQIKEGMFVLNFNRIKMSATEEKEEDIKVDIVLSLCDAKSCLMKRFSIILKDNASEVAAAESKAILEDNVNVHITQDDIKLS